MPRVDRLHSSAVPTLSLIAVRLMDCRARTAIEPTDAVAARCERKRLTRLDRQLIVEHGAEKTTAHVESYELMRPERLHHLDHSAEAVVCWYQILRTHA